MAFLCNLKYGGPHLRFRVLHHFSVAGLNPTNSAACSVSRRPPSNSPTLNFPLDIINTDIIVSRIWIKRPRLR